MKIRKGFVSNSSSSSFVCEICNRTETGFDWSLSDADMVECENYHTFCSTHMLDVQIEDAENDEVDEDEHYISEKFCPICNFVEMSYSDIRRYFNATTSIKEEDVFAEIKKINKRRKKLYSNEYVEYVLKEQGITSDDLLSKLKSEFPSYNDFKEYIRVMEE